MRNQAAKNNWDAYVRARDSGHDEWVELATKCEEFYIGGGKQWSDKDRQKLERQGKPVLEINMILSTVNALMGERINQRAEIRFKPMRSGSAELAESVLTPLARHIQDDNNYHWVEGEAFADGAIQGRGYIDVRLDFAKDVRGEVRMTPLDPRTVIPDPLAKDYDPRTWNEVITTRWMSLDEVEIEYGKKHRKAVEQFAVTGDNLGRYEQDCIDWHTRDSHFGDPDDLVMETQGTIEDIKRVRIIERQHKKATTLRMFVDKATGDMEEIPEKMDDARARTLAAELNLGVLEKPGRKVRWTVSVGDHVVMDEWSPYPTFTIVPFFPYFRRGRPFGIVQNLISPQEQLNKAESQELHIVNTTANSGYTVEAGSLVNMTEHELEERGAETGLVLVHRAGTNPPQKIQPNSVPTGVSRIGEKAGLAIRNISGVYDSLLGDSGIEVSGVKLEQQVKRGLVQFQVPFDNLNRTRQLVGEKLYELIRLFYTEERIYHVADFNTPGYPLRAVEVNKQQFDGSILNDVTIGEYAVTVDVGPSHDNVQETQFAQALELRNAGVAVPDHVVIENSQLMHRHEIAEMIRKMQGFAEPTPEQQQQAQMQQQFMMEMAMAELATNKAKAMLLQAQAQQAMAKAGELEASVQVQMQESQSELELELKKLEQRWAELQANLDNKLQLAGIHSGNKTDLTHYQTLAKQTGESLKRDHDKQLAAIQANTQLTTAQMQAESQKQRAQSQPTQSGVKKK